jgi:hypothetical protein
MSFRESRDAISRWPLNGHLILLTAGQTYLTVLSRIISCIRKRRLLPLLFFSSIVQQTAKDARHRS